MNKSTKSSFTFFLVGLFTIGFLSNRAEGAILLAVDVSDPSAVVLIATTGLAAQTSLGDTSGLDLRGFYTAVAGTVFEGANEGALASLSTLATSEDGSFFDSFLNRSNNLNIFLDGSSGHKLIAGNQAFSGSATFNLSAYTSILPTPGTTGSITLFSSNTSIFGEWSVIPEPSSTLLFSLGGLGLALRRSRY